MKTKLAILLSVMLSTSSVAAETLVIGPGSGWSEGGSPRRYMRERDAVDRVEVRTRCVSSCVLLLGAESACVEPEERIGFHPVRWFHVKVADRHIQRLFADELNRVGNGTLGEWYFNSKEVHSLPASGKYKYLSGQTLIETFGVEEC
jgi:hypothetical protein